MILILSSLMVWLLPNIVGGQQAANEFGCQTNLKNLYENITIYKQRNRNKMPGGGGPTMLWNIWRAVEKTERNRDLFFCPEVRSVDDYYNSEVCTTPLDDLWPNPEDFTSRDTHYACRSKRHYKTMNSGRQAWIADDNEDGANHPSGAINVLYGDGTTRSLQRIQLEDMGLVGWQRRPRGRIRVPGGAGSLRTRTCRSSTSASASRVSPDPSLETL